MTLPRNPDNAFAIALHHLLKAHTPSITEQDEDDLDLRDWKQRQSLEHWDWAEFALRTCSCGTRIDGFYDYIAHLKDVLSS